MSKLIQFPIVMGTPQSLIEIKEEISLWLDLWDQGTLTTKAVEGLLHATLTRGN